MTDEELMRAALDEAKIAADLGEVFTPPPAADAPAAAGGAL